MVVVRVYPNPVYIGILSTALDSFCADMAELETKAKAHGWLKEKTPLVMPGPMGDMGITDDDVGFFQLGTPGADGFNLPAFEHHPRLVPLLDEVVVKGFLIIDNAHSVGCGWVRAEHSACSGRILSLDSIKPPYGRCS
jgi:hypothetical protein